MNESNCVKILEDALKKYKKIPDLHAALIQYGVRISLAALYKGKSGLTKDFGSAVNLALCELVYGGDAQKMKDALAADHGKKKK